MRSRAKKLAGEAAAASSASLSYEHRLQQAEGERAELKARLERATGEIQDLKRKQEDYDELLASGSLASLPPSSRSPICWPADWSWASRRQLHVSRRIWRT